MTQSVFLTPVKKSERSVYVDIKNTSGQELDSLMPLIERKLKLKGYKLIDDPDNARYILLANVLFANDKKENNALNGAIAGGAVGAGVSDYNNGGAGNMVAAGAAGAIIGALIGKFTEDRIFQMVVDINVRENTNKEVTTSKSNISKQGKIKDGDRAGFMNSFAGKVASNEGGGSFDDNTSKKVEQALSVLEKKVATQIAGIF